MVAGFFGRGTRVGNIVDFQLWLDARPKDEDVRKAFNTRVMEIDGVDYFGIHTQRATAVLHLSGTLTNEQLVDRCNRVMKRLVEDGYLRESLQLPDPIVDRP